MLRCDLDRNSTSISKIDHEILSRAMLMLSQRASTSTQRETERAKEHATHERTPGDTDRKSTRLNSSHIEESRMPSSA